MVNSVELTADTYLVCLTHALSTEKEEVMGLLLGEVRRQCGGWVDSVGYCLLVSTDEEQQGCSHLFSLPHDKDR